MPGVHAKSSYFLEMPEVGTKRKRPNSNKPKKTVRFKNNNNSKRQKYNTAPAYVHGNFSNQTAYGPFVTGWQTQTEKEAAYASSDNRSKLIRQGYTPNFRQVISELTKHSNSKIYERPNRNTYPETTNTAIIRNVRKMTNNLYKLAESRQKSQTLKPLPVSFQ